MSSQESNYDSFLHPCLQQQQPQYSYFNTVTNYDYPRTNQGFYTDHLETPTNNWVADIEKRLKFTDKIETLEITSKDLSPASCCSTIDPYNIPYYYNYPSCSQVSSNIQEYDYSEQFYSQPFVDINQTTECASGESDIIVEECYSDEELQVSTTCIVCNVPYTPTGNQFYKLTDKSPLTMSSQRPVYLKLQRILRRNLRQQHHHLCAHCLNLVNTIDHLQRKLEEATTDLLKNNNVKKQRPKFKTSRFTCRFCKKHFTPQRLFEIHLTKHKRRHRFLCELCGRRFKTSSALKVHTLQHRPMIPAFVCGICEKPFRTKTHLKEHHGYCADKYPYECCEKKFATASKLKEHRKLKHEKKFVAICSICNVGFVKMSEYKRHRITHSSEKKFGCVKCGRNYKTASNLKFHMKVHLEKLPFNCKVCDKGFMRKEYLEAHVNNHSGIKNYPCQICEKRFVSQKNLDAHLKYHEGSVKKRSCNICSKVVTTGFEEHLRTHSNLKEFQCDICLMRFNTKGAFSKHKVRKHS